MLFQPGRNYIWIFGVYLSAFLALMAASFVIDFRICFNALLITMPCYAFFLLGSQIRSGCALDNWMVARHYRGTWTYRGRIAWNFVGLILMLGFAFLAWAPRGL